VPLLEDVIEIAPLAGPVRATVTAPGSKSLTNRALLIAALADGLSVLTGALASDDTCYMAGALRALGVRIDEAPEPNGGTRFTITGCRGQFPARQADLNIGASGTAARFLTAAITLGQGHYTLDGIPRMRERPIAPLLDALTQLGADIRSRDGNGCPPVVAEAHGLPGEQCSVRGDVSSQFLSALLMVGPYAGGGINVRVEGELVSRPFIGVTTAIMRDFGVTVLADGDRFRVPPGVYQAREYAIEPDATAASYFFAAAAVTGGSVRVAGLGRDAVQGDLAFTDVLEQMGCTIERAADGITVHGPAQLAGVDADLGPISDTAQTLAAIAPFASGPVTMRGLAHTRLQETDRLAAVTTELRRLGCRVDERPDGLMIYPSALHGGTVATYGDHRMAMSFALPGLRVPGIRIADPGCVAKTFPDYFTRFEQMRMGDGNRQAAKGTPRSPR
jgi:3-phosphoshikimate 1-carboxyvinyltransferase